MAWVDDRIWCHPKFVGLTPKAFRIWVHGTAYSSGFGTRGHLTLAQQATIGCTTRIKLELVVAGLWHHGEDGSVRINDWDEHNGKRDERREKDRVRKQIARASAGQDADKPPDKDGTDERTLTGAPDDGVTGEGLKEEQKQKPRAVTSEVDAQPSNESVGKIIDLSLREAS